MEYSKPQFCRLCYGYTKDADNQIVVNKPQADVVRTLYQEYVKGASLAALVELLVRRNILSLTGKQRWTRAAIDNLLSNIKYVPHIISPQIFLQTQNEKARRSNQEIGEDCMKRKATRYHSLNGLSGLLVCAECGANYRRITRSLGEIVWRCANRVEHGKEICRSSPSIPESSVIELLREECDLSNLDSQTIREKVDHVLVRTDGKLELQINQTQNMSLTL